MVSVTEAEDNKLEAFCSKHQREKTDVIREMIRNLKVED